MSKINCSFSGTICDTTTRQSTISIPTMTSPCTGNGHLQHFTANINVSNSIANMFLELVQSVEYITTYIDLARQSKYIKYPTISALDLTSLTDEHISSSSSNNEHPSYVRVFSLMDFT